MGLLAVNLTFGGVFKVKFKIKLGYKNLVFLSHLLILINAKLQSKIAFNCPANGFCDKKS